MSGSEKSREGNAVDITEIRIKLIANTQERLLAFCSITIDEAFVVHQKPRAMCLCSSLLPNKLVKISSQSGGDGTGSAAPNHSPIDFNYWDHLGSGTSEKTFLARIEIVPRER